MKATIIIALSCTLLLSQLAAARIYDSCKIVPTNGLSITKYYRKNCIHCQRIAPKIEQIIHSIEKSGEQITGIMVDTEACPQDAAEIGAIPTIVVSRDGKELQRTSGDKTYEELVKTITSATGLSPAIFSEEKTSIAKNILTVTKEDFFSKFSGPWVVYFEGERNSAIDQILLQAYRTFNQEIHIAKYIGPDKEIVAGRYYIYDFPGILVMYDGILMRYNGEMTLSSFTDFCTRLASPSFSEITPEEVANIAHPTFVVFYSDAIVANRTFRRIAHDLKMNAQTYKMKVEAKEGESVLRLAVFKNGSKFYYEGDVHDEGAVREWLFHAHFPNISKLTMDNFYSIFHGLKPVVSIVADGGNTREIEEFEEVALERNKGSSSSPYVFSYIDKKEYPKFTETNFGLLHGKPLVVLFDPEKQIFYGRRNAKNESIDKYVQEQLREFEAKALPKYAKEKPKSYKLVLGGGIIIFVIGCAVKAALSTRRKVLLE